MASALISGIPVLLDHSCIVGTSLENTTSGGDETMRNYQKRRAILAGEGRWRRKRNVVTEEA